MAKMRAGLYLGEKDVQIDFIQKPVLREGEALVKVAYGGICGTDMMIYAGKHPRAKAPLAMGHEFCGVIEELNGESSFCPEDRVVIEPTISCGECDACLSGHFNVCNTLKLIGIDQNGGFAEYVAVPFHRLHRIPDQLSNEHAAVTEPVSVAVHSVRRSNMKIGDTIVILGGGPIGLLIGQIARKAGAAEVIISEQSPYRLERAREFGFSVIDVKTTGLNEEVNSRTNGKGADVVFEVAGAMSTALQMTELVKIQGTILVVSVFKQNPSVNLAQMHFREISLKTTRCYSGDDFATAIRLMANQSVNVAPLISHNLPLEDIQKGFSFMEHSDQSMKILFHP